MNYETLLDEIMVNTLSAKELIGFPQRDFHYAVCPQTLKFHTTIFLTSALLALDQKKPIIFLIQVDKLPESAMLYTGKIGPHFGRERNFQNQIPDLFLEHNFPQTSEKHYEYLDKLFCYLGVINVSEKHLVLFIKKGEKNKNLTTILKKLLHKEYSLLALSNCYHDLPTEKCKQQSENLISHILNKKIDLTEKRSFPVLSILSDLLPKEDHPNPLEQLVNTGEMGFDTEKSTSLRFMMR